MTQQVIFDRPILILRGKSYTYEFLKLYVGAHIGTYVGRTLVPQSMWLEVMGYNPSRYIGDNLPVDSVSFNDILLFLDRLKKSSGIDNLMLLDEDLWKGNATSSIYQSYLTVGTEENDHIINRVGNKELLYKDQHLQNSLYILSSKDYREGKIPHSIWSSENSNMQPHEITSSQPDAGGLYDMFGNVWDICQKVEECFDDSNGLVIFRRENETDIEYKRRILKTRLLRGDKLDIRSHTTLRKHRVQSVILKGGAWNVSEESCMSDYSIELDNDERYANAGFRIVYIPKDNDTNKG